MPALYHPPQVTDPFTILTFDEGTNTIAGHSRLNSTQNDAVDPLNDKDPFSFVIPANTYLSGAVISFQRTQLQTGVTTLVATYTLYQGNCVPFISPKASLFSLFTGGSFLGPGTYSVLQSYNVGPGGVVDTLTSIGAYDYLLSFDVRPTGIPEPSTLVLFGFGLLGLAGVRVFRSHFVSA